MLTEYLLDVQPGLYKVIAATDSGNTDRFIHDPMGIAQHEDNSGDWHWMAKDGLGTVRGVYDDTLTEVYAADRDPYGDLIVSAGNNPTPFEYTGEMRDANDLQYHRARYLDTNLGVWVSQDPLETGNRYGYVGANPVNHTDPSGLYDWDEFRTEDNDCIYCIGREGGVPETRLAAFTLQVVNLNSGRDVLVDRNWPYRIRTRKLLVVPAEFDGIPVVENGRSGRFGEDCPCSTYSPPIPPDDCPNTSGPTPTPTPTFPPPPEGTCGSSEDVYASWSGGPLVLPNQRLDACDRASIIADFVSNSGCFSNEDARVMEAIREYGCDRLRNVGSILGFAIPSSGGNTLRRMTLDALASAAVSLLGEAVPEQQIPCAFEEELNRITEEVESLISTGVAKCAEA